MRPVIRRNPNWLPTVFNDLLDNTWMDRVNPTTPAVNVIETEDEYRVEFAAPGLTKEDFHIKLESDKNLLVTMEKKSEAKEDDTEKTKDHYLRREFSYSKFQQRMYLSDNVAKDKISAKMEHGVLAVHLPKVKPEDQKKAEKHIEIL